MSINKMNKVREIRIDPSIFISPPYKKCPKCGKDSFGVLSIFKSHYTRRCKECFYPRGDQKPEIFYLPVLQKKIIYLDQFAISNMMKILNPNTKAYSKQKDKFWLNLFERIYRLFCMQIIVCPYSEFHTDESLVTPYYESLKRMYELLSYGVRFESQLRIEVIQLLDYANKWLSGKDKENVDATLDTNLAIQGEINQWLDRFIISVPDFKENWVDQLREDRDRGHKGFISAFIQWQTETHFTFDDWYKREYTAYGQSVIDRYFQYLRTQIDQQNKEVQISFETLFPPPAVLTFRAIKHFFLDKGLSENKAIEKTIEFLKSPSLENVPFVRIYALLAAALARKAAAGQKNPPNQGTANDITAISFVLPYCDAIFIDNECAALLKEKPLSERINYGTKIFSLNNKNEFIDYLDSLEKNISPVQVHFLNEVYGDSWKKSFNSIYQELQGDN